MKFLDTSFLIDVIRKKPSAKLLLEDLDKGGPHATNTIVVHEFLVGALGAKNPRMELSIRRNLLDRLIIFDFDITAANQSAKIENDLRSKGELIGGADILIAGTAISKGILTIVTNNSRHFQKIENLLIESW